MNGSRAGGVQLTPEDTTCATSGVSNPKIKVQVDKLSGNVEVVTLANAAAGTLQDTMLGANDIMHRPPRSCSSLRIVE